MKKYLLLVVMIMTGVMASFASDTLRIDRKYYEMYRWDRNFVSQLNYNPSLYFLKHDFSFSEIGIKGNYVKNNQSLLLQQGEGIKTISVNTSTFTVFTPNSKVWGTASYENSIRDNVRFNNTSDYQLLSPYIMADSVGGDMKGETYSFSGGYGHQIKKYTLAATLSYRALIEHRDVDPRPKNVVSDLQASVGVSRLLFNDYRLGLSFNTGKYKQTNTVKNYSELGAVPQYHLTGLGTEYSRFAGTFLNTFYDGFSYGGSLNLIPDNNNGFYGSVSYDRFTVDKFMSDLNDIQLTALTNRKISAEMAYLKKQNGVKVEFYHTQKIGTENIFGAASGNYYPLITSQENYHNNQSDLSLTGLLSGRSWIIMPQIAYNDNSIKHSSGNNHLHSTFIRGKVDFSYSLKHPKATHTITFGVSYSKNIRNEGELNYTVESMKPLIDSYLELSKIDVYGGYLKARTDIPISSMKSGLFVELNVRYDNLLNIGTSFSLGYSF